jgi:hypothetical protein
MMMVGRACSGRRARGRSLPIRESRLPLRSRSFCAQFEPGALRGAPGVCLRHPSSCPSAAQQQPPRRTRALGAAWQVRSRLAAPPAAAQRTQGPRDHGIATHVFETLTRGCLSVRVLSESARLLQADYSGLALWLRPLGIEGVIATD